MPGQLILKIEFGLGFLVAVFVDAIGDGEDGGELIWDLYQTRR
jgi:hypothetical protein